MLDRMGRALSILVLLALASTPARAQISSVIGRAVDSVYASAGPTCPPELICLDSWYRYTIRVTRVVGGAPVSGTVRAVALQHTDLRRSYRRSLRFFVLRPIETAETRRELRADYYLDALSPEYRVYCTSGTPEALAISPDHVLVRGDDNFCFRQAAPDR